MKDQATVTAFFSKDPVSYADEYARETADGYSFRMRKDRLLESLGSGSGSLLDLGCGPGVMGKEIAALGWKYHGADISHAMIIEARTRAPHLHFTVEDGTRVGAKDGSYEVVVAMGLVEYIDDAHALQEFFRLLMKGGRLFVSIPNWWSPARMWDRWILSPIAKVIRTLTGRKSKATYHREYSLISYQHLLMRHGFTPIRAVAYNFRVVPRPFDLWFPRLSIFFSKLLEPLRHTPLKFIATAYILEAIKRE